MAFSPDEDSPIVPVWLEMPGLPANFYSEAMIRSIAGSIGPVLKVDRNTLCLIRTLAARVCVQLDVSKKLPHRVWIGTGNGGAWHPLLYPAPPLFCSSCNRLGHLPSTCKKKLAANAGPAAPLAEARGSVAPAGPQDGPPHLAAPAGTKRVWRPAMPNENSTAHSIGPPAAATDAIQQPPTLVEASAPPGLKDAGGSQIIPATQAEQSQTAAPAGPKRAWRPAKPSLIAFAPSNPPLAAARVHVQLPPPFDGATDLAGLQDAPRYGNAPSHNAPPIPKCADQQPPQIYTPRPVLLSSPLQVLTIRLVLPIMLLIHQTSTMLQVTHRFSCLLLILMLSLNLS